MNVVVFGPNGMLGRAVVRAAKARGYQPIASRADITSRHLHREVDILAARRRPDLVAINCAGIIPQRDRGPERMISVNAVGPLNLAAACGRAGVRLVHVSTDCVFSGETQGRIHVGQKPDPGDLYGRSKLLGEAIAERHAVVRTSFVGPEHGLMRWLLDQPKGATVEGWLQALWTGSTVQAVARGLLEIAASGETGLMHLATQRVYSKCEVLELMTRQLGLPVSIERVSTPSINRALAPTHLLPPFEKAAEELCR